MQATEARQSPRTESVRPQPSAVSLPDWARRGAIVPNRTNRNGIWLAWLLALQWAPTTTPSSVRHATQPAFHRDIPIPVARVDQALALSMPSAFAAIRWVTRPGGA